MNKTKTEEKRPKQKIVWSVLDSWRLSLSLSLPPPPHLCARLRSRVCGCVRARACMCVCACARSRLKLLFFIHLRCFFLKSSQERSTESRQRKKRKKSTTRECRFPARPAEKNPWLPFSGFAQRLPSYNGIFHLSFLSRRSSRWEVWKVG